MASLRSRQRKNGTTYYSVLYRHNGRQSSCSFEDFAEASRFCGLVDKFGPENALSVERSNIAHSLSVQQWIEHYLDHLTGVEPETVAKYRAYLRNDIGPFLGGIPLTGLTGDHVRKWLQSMNKPDEDGWQPSPKTIRNKHGLLAAALAAAVPVHMTGNPCDGIRLPRWTRPEMVFLTPAQFHHLLDAVTEPWRPLVEFLVASGCRWGEASALRPSNVDRDAGTVSIVQAWKYGEGKHRLGPPKTKKSVRTIDVPRAVLDKLDYSREFLFVNRAGNPVRSHGFARRVWAPAVERAWPSVGEPTHVVPAVSSAEVLRPRIHDLRHSCASWMIQNGVVLPVVRDHLGHESIQTTVDLYGHLDRRAMATAATAVDEALRRSEGPGT